MKDKIISFNKLSNIKDSHPDENIVHCHGVFDLIHIGHVRHFQSAKKFGSILVVTITDDPYVNKGPNRPYNTAADRAIILASLVEVDYVAINPNPTAIMPINTLKPDYYVKGPDYRDKTSDITGGIIEEENAVKKYGGELVFTDDETDSSTAILNKFFLQYTDEQTETIEKVSSVATTSEIIDYIEKLSSLKILVVGEPIIDTYVFTQPLGLGSKSPIVSSKVLYRENYAGGTLAIANHMSALGCSVGLMIPHGNEPIFEKLLSKSLDDSIDLLPFEFNNWPTPRKTRFVSEFQAQKIFEINEISNDLWVENDPSNFLSELSNQVSRYDMFLCADFGHGVFTKSVINRFKKLKIFKAVNVQTNSANQGFNLFIKHDSYDYLCIDKRELRLGMHDRKSDVASLIEAGISDNKLSAPVSITLGAGGSLYVDAEGDFHQSPIFFKNALDTTGAGDAYLTLTSLLVKLKAPGPVVTFLGNCFAGLKTRIIGNKKPVSKTDLIKTVIAILGE